MPNSPRRFLSIALTLSVLWSTSVMGEVSGLWTGEVVDAKCYLASDASSRNCGDATAVKNGQPMGLLTDDGTLGLLAARKWENKAYETLRARFGQRVRVFGTLAERDGMRVLTVIRFKADR